METFEVLEVVAERMENPNNWLPGHGASDDNSAADGGVCWCIGGHLGLAIEGRTPAEETGFGWRGSDAPQALADALLAEGAEGPDAYRSTDASKARSVIYKANEQLDHATLLRACKRAARDAKAKAGISLDLPADTEDEKTGDRQVVSV